jgi:hypothetical protein
MLGRAMEPARDDNAERTERELENVIDKLSRREGF